MIGPFPRRKGAFALPLQQDAANNPSGLDIRRTARYLLPEQHFGAGIPSTRLPIRSKET